MKSKIFLNSCSVVCLFLFLTFTSIYVKMAYGQPGEGEQIYSEYCGGCHNGGFVGWITGAPETGNKSKWEPFFKKGVDKMTASAIKGVGRMDPKGGCDKCSDEQIRSAVEYIMSKTAQ